MNDLIELSVFRNSLHNLTRLQVVHLWTTHRNDIHRAGRRIKLVLSGCDIRNRLRNFNGRFQASSSVGMIMPR